MNFESFDGPLSLRRDGWIPKIQIPDHIIERAHTMADRPETGLGMMFINHNGIIDEVDTITDKTDNKGGDLN